MILDKNTNLSKYLPADYFQTIWEGYKKHVGEPKGEYRLSDTLLLKRVISKTKILSDAKIESHKWHIDIQFPLDRAEMYYIYSESQVLKNSEYDSVDDLLLYSKKENEKCRLLVEPGEFILLEPGEIHQCQIASDEITPIEKIVIKIEMKL